MDCKIIDGNLVITLPLDPKPTKSGKGTNIGGTSGFEATAVKHAGLPVSVSVTATIPKSWPDLVAANAKIDATTTDPKLRDALKAAAYAEFMVALTAAMEAGNNPDDAAEVKPQPPAKPVGKARSILG